MDESATDAPSADDGDGLRDALTAAVEPLSTIDPDDEFDDLAVIGDHIGDADVIGMGESSHGTREFFRFKHRLFRYLVREHDVRMLGLEANFAAALDINEYVLHGDGSAAAALCQDPIHRPHRNESLLALIEWMRGFNEGRDPAAKIRFHGLDIQFPAAAAAKLEAYFERVDPDALAAVESDVATLLEGSPDLSETESVLEHLAARDAVRAELQAALAAHESEYVEATSRRASERAARLVWTIDRGHAQLAALVEGEGTQAQAFRIRDAAMAAQVRWLLAREPGDRMALWAHNGHLTRGAFTGGRTLHEQGIASLGRTLAELPDVTYYALGLIAGGGAVNATYAPEREYREYEIETPPEGSVPELLGLPDEELYFLDLAGLPEHSPIAEWAASEPLQYVILSGYRETPVNRINVDVRRQFDGVVFARTSTPARPLEAAD